MVAENINPKKIFVTGNTVIDSLLLGQRIIKESNMINEIREKYAKLINGKKYILVTGHRRENFGKGFEEICSALIKLTIKYKDVKFIYPLHLNPKVAIPVREKLKNINAIKIIEPLDYLPFIYLMENATIILTDSGGIQEEAPTLGKQVVVMRDTSERPEAVKAGFVTIAGTKSESIVNTVSNLLDNPKDNISNNPYGDGKACEKIINIIKTTLI